MKRRALCVALVAVLPAMAWAQVRLGAEIQVNTYTTGLQTHAGVGSDADGNFVVAWVSYAPDFLSGNVFARRYDAAGAALDASEFQVSDATSSYAGYPFLSSDQSGNFAVIWRHPTNSDDVFARPYDAAGTPVTGAFRVNTYTTFAQSPGGVASDAIGNFVVVWSSFRQDGSYDGIFARRYDALGAPRGLPFQVNSHTTGYQYAGSVGSDAYGNFLVAWHSDDQDGSLRGIYAQRYDAAGDAQGTEFRVNTSTTGDQIGPSVASDLAGNFVVVWTGPDGNGRGIFGQRYDVSGTPLGGEFRVNTWTTANQSFPVVSADAKGFVVAWTSFGRDNSSYAVMARRYGQGGVPQGDEFVVNSYTTGQQAVSGVASGADGSFVVVWSSLNQDGDSGGVFAQRFATDVIFADGFD